MKIAFVGKQIVANLNKLYSNPLKGEGKYIFFKDQALSLCYSHLKLSEIKKKHQLFLYCSRCHC